MGASLSRPKLAAAVGVGGGLLVALTCLTLAAAVEEEKPCLSAAKPSQEDKALAKDANQKLQKAADQIVLERLPVQEAQQRLHEAFEEISGTKIPLHPSESIQPQETPLKAQPRREDIVVKGLLGCGGFGAVELVEDKASSGIFARKSISKGYIVKQGMQDSVRNEMVILSLVSSPFIVKFYSSHNRQQFISFLLEPCLGGELYATYKRKSLHGSAEHARYYIACLTLGLAHLHSLHVVCRGVKPEDCVLDSKGQMKLCDMGLAKLVVGKTFTTCGTPDYLAPELIASKGHHFPVDWWCVGIMLFELLANSPPFESSYPMQIYSKVMKGIDSITFPAVTKDAEKLIKSMCKQNPQERLPMKAGGVENLKKDSFFGAFDWKALEQESLQAPYIPIVEDASDISNFSARAEDVPKMIEYVDDGSGWAGIFGPEECP